MELLVNKIKQDGRVLPGDILKVDSFLNHQIDPDLFMKMGEDFYQHFKDKNITKILTLEVSGIAIAFAAATYFKVPVLFAKKSESKTLSDATYSAKVVSYTKGKEYDIRIDRRFLSEDDRVLIIDDFLANGQAVLGLIDLCRQAKASVEGVGIAIEKSFQVGGSLIRKMGVEVYSQARVKAFEDNQVLFEEE